jgi:hypothetical protein
MKCDRHMWDTTDTEWCWRCEELTINENKKKYENQLRDNGLQRVGGDKEIGSFSLRTQETSGRNSDSL